MLFLILLFIFARNELNVFELCHAKKPKAPDWVKSIVGVVCIITSEGVSLLGQKFTSNPVTALYAQ